MASPSGRYSVRATPAIVSPEAIRAMMRSQPPCSAICFLTNRSIGLAAMQSRHAPPEVIRAHLGSILRADRIVLITASPVVQPLGEFLSTRAAHNSVGNDGLRFRMTHEALGHLEACFKAPGRRQVRFDLLPEGPMLGAMRCALGAGCNELLTDRLGDP